MKQETLSGLIDRVGKVTEDLSISETELRRSGIDAALIGRVVERAQVQSEQFFVAGWRPFIGWIGALGLAYQFLLYPVLLWLWAWMQGVGWVPQELAPPPAIEADKLWVMIVGTLGVAGMRSFDKLKGTQTLQVGKPK